MTDELHRQSHGLFLRSGREGEAARSKGAGAAALQLVVHRRRSAVFPFVVSDLLGSPRLLNTAHQLYTIADRVPCFAVTTRRLI